MLPATSMLEHWLVFHSLLWSLAQCDASKITVPIYKVLQYTQSLPPILACFTLQCDIRHFSEPLQEAFVKRTRLLVCTDVWGLAPLTAPVRHTLVRGRYAVDPSSSGDYRGSTLPRKEKLPERSFSWQLCRFSLSSLNLWHRLRGS